MVKRRGYFLSYLDENIMQISNYQASHASRQIWELISSGSSISLVLSAVFFIYVSLQKFKAPRTINLGLLEMPKLTIQFYDDLSQKKSAEQQNYNTT